VGEAIEAEKDRGKMWTEIARIRNTVFGNGSIGHEQRIMALETRVKIENCIGVKAMNEYEKAINSRKSFDMTKALLIVAIAAIIVDIILGV